MKNFSMVLQGLAAIAVLIAAVPLTLNQLDMRTQRNQVRERAHWHGSLGDAAVEAGDHLLAAQSYADALAMDPGNAKYKAGLLDANVTRILSDASVIKSDPLRLHAQLADAVTRMPDPSARILTAFGRVLQFRRQGEQAVARFEQAVKVDPKFADAHLYLGDAALKSKKLETASKHLGLALELKPDMAVARFALGQLRLQQDKTDEAITLLTKAAETLPNGKVYMALGRAHLRNKAWVKAEQALERALALDRTQVGAHRLLADAYVANKKFEAAAGAYKLAYERARDVDAYRKLGRLFARSGQPQAALKIFNELRSLFPDDVEAHCQIGNTSFALRQLGVAKVAFEKCLELGTDKPDYASMTKVAREELAKVAELIRKVQAEQAAQGSKKKRGG
jgi:tetratricopeptide (TPR) repeat protein